MTYDMTRRFGPGARGPGQGDSGRRAAKGNPIGRGDPWQRGK